MPPLSPDQITLDAVFDHLYAGIALVRNGAVENANQVFFSLVSLPPEEILHRQMEDLLTPPSVNDAASLFNGDELRFERREFLAELHRNGQDDIPVLVRRIPLSDAGSYLYLLNDLTEKNRTQAELTRLASFPDLNPNPIIEVDKEGQIRYLNQAALVRFPDLHIQGGEHPLLAGLSATIALTPQEGSSFVREVPCNDRIYEQLVTFVPATDLLRLYISDVTERVHYEEHLQFARNEAETSNRLKSEFLANMSHEIRTPLNIIFGYADLIRERIAGSASDDVHEFFTLIHQAGNQLTETIEKIIDISRFHIADFPIKPQPLALSYLIESIVHSFEVLANKKHLTLSMEIERPDFTIQADQYAVTESLTNVIGNAIKYTMEGEVHVHVYQVGPAEVVVAVEDSGIGIADSFLPFIFDEFSQEESGYGRRYEGTGLGLALTKKFVEACDGTINVTSRKGEGSTFSLRFPLIDWEGTLTAGKQEAYPPADGKTPARSRHRASILVVDDDDLTQKFMRILLEEQYVISFAADAEEVLTLLRTRQIDVMLLDLSLQGDIDGITLMKLIRNDTLLRELPIVVLTAHAFERDRENAANAGCDAFLTKPFKRYELLSVIRNLLSKR